MKMAIETDELFAFDTLLPNTDDRYKVIYAKDHETLKIDDEVMIKDYKNDNLLLRLKDMTLHGGYINADTPIILYRLPRNGD